MTVLVETDKLPHVCEIRWRGNVLGYFRSNLAGDVDLPDRLDQDAAYAAAEAMGAVAVVNERAINET